ncbi:sigma-54-dependent transcriptional regulator [Dongshaea marina]|uniref:sigma-54-dependent transcriptional regulator n=1 Tax=Dongshaea marina TaxID=2047966 RepID=UPI000D3EC132|nr:sigma-54 dependent transcriptional regulator [Dongshaea marina]
MAFAQGKQLLLIEPHQGQGRSYREALKQAGYDCLWERSFSCIEADDAFSPALVLCSLSGMDSDCARQFATLRQRFPGARFLVLIHFSDVGLAAQAMHLGAEDFLLCPMSKDLFIEQVNRQFTREPCADSVIAHAWQSRRVLQLAQRVARTQATVLICAESGSGKEVLARYIHQSSGRSTAPFVAINCAAIPESMLESLLFGHEKGAYTGALSARAGKFEQAQGGTLFLDEIAELPLGLQAKLLRVLQEREVERLGGRRAMALDIRLIAATNQDLKRKVALGEFREDLYYRLDVFPLTWEPLRERRADIGPLAEFFIERYARQMGITASVRLTSSARRLLTAHGWPGNVRELENVIQRSLILCDGEVIEAEDLMLPIDPSSGDIPESFDAQIGLTRLPQRPEISESASPPLSSARVSLEFQHVIDVLRRFDGHRTKAAAELGVTTRALRYKLAKMKQQGIDINDLIAVPALS